MKGWNEGTTDGVAEPDPWDKGNRAFPGFFESVCQEADRLVSGARNEDYGHPLDDYGKVSGMAKVLSLDVTTPEGAAMFMVLVKVSREVNRHKRDNLVDMAGYAKCIDMIHEEREARSE